MKMINKNYVLCGIFLVLLTSVFSLSFISSYTRSSVASIPGGFSSDFFSGTGIPREKCEAGSDFVVQVAPLGCTPIVVRSDLLEDSDVPVFCQLALTKINPLVDVKAIDRISFSGKYPEQIGNIRFHSSKAALGINSEQINSPILDNIGYVVIGLKRQTNESKMPDFVSGNVTATIRYNLENAFGIGEVNFYLPLISSDEWSSRKNQYSFWRGKGYLRAQDIDSDSATIVLSNDVNEISRVNLKVGEKSNRINIPGFECLAGLNLKLDRVEAPETRVRLGVNGDVYEFKEGEKFLDKACTVERIAKYGLVERARIKCQGESAFDLYKAPKIKLEIDGIENDYAVGDYLFSYKFKDDLAVYNVYLGYIGNSGEGEEKNLIASIYSKLGSPDQLSVQETKLSEDEIEYVKNIYEAYSISGRTDITLGSFLTEFSELTKGFFQGTLRTITTSDNIEDLKYNEEIYFPLDDPRILLSTQVKLLGYGSSRDLDLSKPFYNEVTKNYNSAKEDFDAVKTSFSSTKYPDVSETVKGEEALYEEMKLASNLAQHRTLVELCEKFYEAYPKSSLMSEIKKYYCDDKVEISGSSVRSRTLLLDNQAKTFFLDRVYQPTFEDFGATVLITFKDGKESKKINFVRNQRYYLNVEKNDYISLDNLNVDFATMSIYVSKGIYGDTKDFVSGPGHKLEKGKTELFNDYTVTLQEIKLKKVAKVSVSSQIDKKQTQVDFPFKIEIEKRAVKLSPDKIREKIINLNKSIEEWNRNLDRLGSVVTGLKTACVGTNLYLTAKNFLANAGGKGIARQKVMRDNGGWYDVCEELVKKDKATYKSIDSCFLKYSSEIDSDVNELASRIDEHNTIVKGVEDGVSKKDAFGTSVVNTPEYKKKYVEYLKSEGKLKENLKEFYKSDSVSFNEQNIPIDDFVNNLNPELMGVSDLNDLSLFSKTSSSNTLSEISKANLNRIIGDYNENNKVFVDRKTLSEDYGISVDIGASTKLSEIKIYEDYLFKDVRSKFAGSINIDDNSFVRIYVDQSTKKEYLLALDNDRIVERTYLIEEDGQLNLYDSPNPLSLSFKKVDEKYYKNSYESSIGEIEPILRYFETDPYRGFPAIVPFDLKNGWYVSIKQVLPLGAGGQIRSYDESGRLNSFYLCNVGKNNREENRGGDDECRSFINSQNYNNFYGLDEQETRDLVQSAINAVEQAQIQREKDSNLKYAIITYRGNQQKIKVGEPAFNVPDISCTDVYSPADCKLLFNVCDPVICPSSRCDLGGAYPVKDVVQSGIFGSIALCLPNFPDVYIPVCLSGIHAGIEGWNKIQESYRDCLQHNLETGETVGICDELFSIYKCEMFWRQAVPLTKIAIPKILQIATGQNTKGGGEYLGIQNALDNVKKSTDFFTQYYAQNTYAKFKAKSTEQVGSDVCRSFISGVLPIPSVDVIAEPDSPTQFHGWFDEISYTTSTNPPASHYKVFYHIYAGKDRGAYYRVYLKGTAGSFYQDTGGIRVVATGYIGKGEVASDTPDFIAPEGYKELCIVVNDQEECGFKQVSTEFGLNYIQDKYIQQQANRSDIKTERECRSGSVSLYGLVNPNLQSGLNDAINPEIYNHDLVRICATKNPGIENVEVKESRWVDVGYCDDQKMRCWVDMDSVQVIIKNLNIEKQTLSDLEKSSEEVLRKEYNYMSEIEFKDAVDKIKESNDPELNIKKINDLFERVVFNNQNGHLFYLRGIEYGSITKKLFFGIPLPVEPIKTTEPEKQLDVDKDKAKFERGSSYIDPTKIIIFSFGNLYYSFPKDEWLVSIDGKEWNTISNILSVSDSIQREVDLNQGAVPTDATSVGLNQKLGRGVDVLRISNPRELGLMNDLNGADYKGGLELIIQATRDLNLELKTQKVVMNKDMLFTIEDVEYNKIFKFKFGTEGWIVSSYGVGTAYFPDYYKPSELDKVDPTKPNGFIVTERLKTIARNLDGKEFYDGARILFSVNLPDLFVSVPDYLELDKEIKNEIRNEIRCEDCGTDSNTLKEIFTTGLDICTEDQCAAISKVSGKVCVYEKGFWDSVFGGSCKSTQEERTILEFKQENSDEVAAALKNVFGVNSLCLQYVDDVVKFSFQNNVDPLLVFSLMYQESKCVSSASSESSTYIFDRGASYGLMQISGKTWCGQYGLSSEASECKRVLLSDTSKNIEVGIKILVSKYNVNPIIYRCEAFASKNQNEPKIYKSYYGWERALREYNGRFCAKYNEKNEEVFSDHYFVEEIITRYKELSSQLNV